MNVIQHKQLDEVAAETRLLLQLITTAANDAVNAMDIIAEMTVKASEATT